ncbi:MAG: FtsB family cell division protein [Flavobacteriales bacterium]
MKRRLLLFFKNKYALASCIFLLWICLFNDIDLFFIISSRREVNDMKNEYENLDQQHALARQQLTDLNTNQHSLEKFARETYYMKRDNEDVFVFKERAE